MYWKEVIWFEDPRLQREISSKRNVNYFLPTRDTSPLMMSSVRNGSFFEHRPGNLDKNFHVVGRLLWCLPGHDELFGINIFRPPLYVISRRNDAESGRGIKSKGEGWNRGRRARDNGGYESGTPVRSHFRIRATQSDEKARRRENVRWILNALAVDVPEEPCEEAFDLWRRSFLALHVEN